MIFKLLYGITTEILKVYDLSFHDFMLTETFHQIEFNQFLATDAPPVDSTDQLNKGKLSFISIEIIGFS